MARKRTNAGTFTVSGPSLDWDKGESPNGAIVYAQNIALRADDVLTLYVRAADGRAVARIERDTDGIVYTVGLGSDGTT